MPDLPFPNGSDDASFATQTEAAAQLLSDAILSGTMAPGARLNIRAISETTGIGPTPIREALANLAGRGLVTFAGQRGFRVVPVSREDLAGIMTARTVVERGALALSIANGGEEWEVEIVASLHRLRMFTEHPPTGMGARIEAFERAHRNYHVALIAACGSEKLIAIFVDLYEQTRRYRGLMLNQGTGARDALAQHERMAQHCLARDVESALEDMASHNTVLLDAIYWTDPSAGQL